MTILPRHRRTSLYLLLFLAATTAVTVFGSLMSYRALVRAAEDSLRLQAFGIGVSLEAYANQWHAGKENIFRDIITEGTWEAIAYLSLADHTGTILLHSNDSLIGKKLDDRSLRDVLEGGRPVTHRVVLGTGEEVFVLDLPILSETGTRILSLALHMQPTETMFRQAQWTLAIMGGLMVILWGTGFFLIMGARRSETLETALREKEHLAAIGEMASVLAHEIRNPLGSIKGYAQYLLERPATVLPPAGRPSEPLPEDVKEYLDVIISESRRLEGLTQDMLVYARPEEVRRETFDLPEFLSHLTAQMQKQEDLNNRRVDIDIRIPSGLRITTDSDKLRQILTNVLQNAIDAVQDDGRIEISASKEGDVTRIAVQDNGAGMDPETIKNAFKPFFTTKTRGTGLGLAIVEKLARSLDGSVTISSRPPEGTLVEVRLHNPQMGTQV